jgi:FixJ family two-component response regulator
MTLHELTVRRIRDEYGSVTASVVSAFLRGWKNETVARKFGLSRTSVATYRANFTRGVYC